MTRPAYRLLAQRNRDTVRLVPYRSHVGSVGVLLRQIRHGVHIPTNQIWTGPRMTVKRGIWQELTA